MKLEFSLKLGNYFSFTQFLISGRYHGKSKEISKAIEYNALYARERKKAKILMNSFSDLMLSVRHVNPSIRRGGMLFGLILILNTVTAMCDFDELETSPDRQSTIDSFSEGQCWNYFETRKEDLPRLSACLRIPEVVRLSNRKCSRPGGGPHAEGTDAECVYGVYFAQKLSRVHVRMSNCRLFR